MIGVTKPRNWNGHDMPDYLKCEMTKKLGKAFSDPGQKQSFITGKLPGLCGDQKLNRSLMKKETDQSALLQDWFKLIWKTKKTKSYSTHYSAKLKARPELKHMLTLHVNKNGLI